MGLGPTDLPHIGSIAGSGLSPVLKAWAGGWGLGCCPSPWETLGELASPGLMLARAPPHHWKKDRPAIFLLDSFMCSDSPGSSLELWPSHPLGGYKGCWPHGGDLSTGPPCLLPQQHGCVHRTLAPTQGTGRKDLVGGQGEAYSPPVCTKLWFTMAHLAVLRAVTVK